MLFERISQSLVSKSRRRRTANPPAVVEVGQLLLPHAITNVAIDVISSETVSVFTVDTKRVEQYAARLAPGEPASSPRLCTEKLANNGNDQSFPVLSESPMLLFNRPTSRRLAALGRQDLLVIDKETLTVFFDLYTMWDPSLMFGYNSSADYLCHDREDLYVVASSMVAGCIFDTRCAHYPVLFFGDPNNGRRVAPARRNQPFLRHQSVVGITSCCGFGEYAAVVGLADGTVGLCDLRNRPSTIEPYSSQGRKRLRSCSEEEGQCSVRVGPYVAALARNHEEPTQIAALSSTGSVLVCDASRLTNNPHADSLTLTHPLPTPSLHCVKRSAGFVPGSGGCLACTWPSGNGDLVCFTPPYSDQNVAFGSIAGGGSVPYSHFAVGIGFAAVCSSSGKASIFSCEGGF